MILKKPYAFLIRHFKLIHIIMVILLGYLIYKTNLILNFLNQYMSAKELVTGRSLVDPLFSVYIYISLGIIILMSVFIFILLTVKKKPITFYFLNIITCLGLIAIYIFVQNVIGIMEKEVVSLQMIRLIRDLLTIAVLFETSSFLINFIRGIGFNIKKFNFEDEYRELNIETKDSEEFELEFNVDTSKFKRNWYRWKRHFKYAYKEHKFLINMGILLFILFLSFFISFLLGLFDKEYEEKILFTTNNYIMGINNSYVVTKDYKDNKINDTSKFIILKLSVKNRYNFDTTFNSASSGLVINDNTYYHQTKYLEAFKDLGEVYNNQEFSNESKNYILVYEVPLSLELKNCYFTYKDFNEKRSFNVKLNINDLEEKTSLVEASLGQPLEIDNIFKAKIIIDQFEMANNFKFNYNYCVSNEECYNSTEYLYPTLKGHYDKALLKISGSLEFDNSIEKISSLYGMINYFGYIEYEKNQEFKRQNNLTLAKPNNVKVNEYYFEINRDILNSSQVNLVFKIRNVIYKYKLR